MFVSGSLLTWHCGMVRRWPATCTWSLGYAFMALGGLTKGPQAPAYFVGAVTMYLVCTGQWRRLFSVAHLIGVGVALAILATWHVPYAFRVGLDGVRTIWLSDTAPRLLEWQGMLEHFATFPLEVLGCTLPWSPLIFLFLRRDLRQSLAAARPHVLFLAICLGVALPTCWLPPGGMTRYIAPLYPCFALLLGFVVQRCGEAEIGSPLGVAWRRYLSVTAMVLVLTAAGSIIVLFTKGSRLLGVWADPPLLAALFSTAALGMAWWLRQARAASFPWRTGSAVAALAAFMVLLFNGPVLNARIRRGEDAGAAIARLKERLPADATFVSLGYIDSEFPFFYDRFVEPLPWPSATPPAVPAGGYFCFNAEGLARPHLPFPWEEVAAISMDRNKHAVPGRVLVVARRLPANHEP